MDLTAASLFLQQLEGSPNPTIAFRTFLDNKNAPKDPALSVKRYGKFDDIKDELARLNVMGAGVFFTVQRTNGTGITNQDVTQIRSAFVDLDGSLLDPVLLFPLKPHIIVESSPHRWHCYWLIDATQPLALPLFESLQVAIAEKFNGDKSVKDLARVLRLPGYFHKKDPTKPFLVNIHQTNDLPRYPAEQILEAFAISPKTGKQKTLPVAIGQGQRETRIMTFLGQMRRVGASEESMLAAATIENQRCTPPLAEIELIRMAHSVSKYPTNNDDFHRDPQSGKIYANHQGNIKIGLEKLGVEVKYDEFADQYLYTRTNDDGKQGPDKFLDDVAINHLWLEGDEAFRFRPSIDFFTKVVMDRAAHQGRFHPVLDYFKSLRAWDGTERIDTWLIKYGGAEDSEYVRTVGRITLLAAVKRVKHPGVKYDELLVLMSLQGKDKSSTLKALCPNESWFSDSLALDSDSQKVIEQTNGKWIIEVSELAGMKKQDIEMVKGFLSRTHDTARKAYDRMVTTRARHFIMIGTTNNPQFARDTENRRLWPVKTPGFNAKEVAKIRNQLWAEALHKEAESTDEDIRLPQHLWPAAAVHQNEARQEDPWETKIQQTLNGLRGRITNEEVWKIVNMHDVAKRTQACSVRVGDAMKHLGFERTRVRVGETIRPGFEAGDTDKERAQFIRIRLNEDNGPEAYIMDRAQTQEWEVTGPVEAAINKEVGK